MFSNFDRVDRRQFRQFRQFRQDGHSAISAGWAFGQDFLAIVMAVQQNLVCDGDKHRGKRSVVYTAGEASGGGSRDYTLPSGHVDLELSWWGIRISYAEYGCQGEGVTGSVGGFWVFYRI